MTLFEPTIEHFVTTVLVVIEPQQTVAQAARLMREHGFHHLPVMHGGRPVGVISERDILLIETLRDVDPHEVLVEEAMSPKLYLVDPEAPMRKVAADMADRHYGCAIVARGDEVYGVFTTTDALRALSVSQTIDPD
ncbi:MAG: CBS domain-containing protein [Planctomycetes bacterium]|nr:CBS domain-containing protein [Planctomycetota bacterium]MCB9904446.1 CBS domain-containing protein [Planctomycetota bacterium]